MAMKKKKKAPIKQHITDGKLAIKEIMQENLAQIAASMISQIMAKAKKLPKSKRLDAIKNVDQPGVNDYKNSIKTALAIIATDAIDQIRKEIPKAKKVKLAQGNGSQFHLSEFDDLPPDLQKRIQTESQLLVGTQLSDLEKVVFFQFTSSYDSTDSDDLLESDLEGAAEDYIGGASIDAGSGLLSAEVVNTARNAFYMDDEVNDQIDALQFVNGDPVTTICQKLDGVIFDANDPLADRFQPPFHWNCKTYIIPILKGNLDSEDDIEPLSDYANLESEMQFSEDQSKVLLLLSEMNSHQK